MSSTPEVLGDMNKNKILKLLRKEGPLSRADISRILDLSFPAVTSNIKALQKAGLVRTVGEGNNVIGRKSTLLAFNAEKGYVVGVDIGRSKVRVMCADLAGNVLEYNKGDLINCNGKDPVSITIDTIHKTVEESGVDINDVLCIGVGIPGVYDEKTDKHMLAPFLKGWENFSIMAALRKNFNNRIIIENSVNLGAIGERWKGAAQNYKDICYLNYGVGIGSSIILDGKLIQGSNKAAGEIGYMLLEKELLRDDFKNEGSLEELICSQAYHSGLNSQKATDTFYDAIQKSFIKYSEYIPSYFVMSIINLICIVNPEIVVISGKLGEKLFNKYKEELFKYASAHVPFLPKIVCSELSEKANVLGAVSIGIHNVNSNYKNICSLKDNKI